MREVKGAGKWINLSKAGSYERATISQLTQLSTCENEVLQLLSILSRVPEVVAVIIRQRGRYRHSSLREKPCCSKLHEQIVDELVEGRVEVVHFVTYVPDNLNETSGVASDIARKLRGKS